MYNHIDMYVHYIILKKYFFLFHVFLLSFITLIKSINYMPAKALCIAFHFAIFSFFSVV